MVESESLSIASLELAKSQQGAGCPDITGLLGVFGLPVGVGVQWGLDGKCSGEEAGVPFGVLTGDGHCVSFGTRSSVDGYLGDQ